jgi:hypothetical protein
MRQEMASTRRKRIGFRVMIALLAVALMGIALPSLFVAQTHGVCLKAGRVLSAEELRRRVSLSVVNKEIESAISYNSGFDNDRNRIGIVSPAAETDPRKLLEIFLDNEKSFEERFGIEILVRGRKNISPRISNLNWVQEPFLLVSLYVPYDASGGVKFYVSFDTQEVKPTKSEIEHELRKQHEFTLYERLSGYGNHYFYTPYRFGIYYDIRHECCGDKFAYVKKKQSREEFLEHKRLAYLDALSNLDSQAAKMQQDKRIAIVMVSNCGDILMTETNDPGFSLPIVHRVSWTKGK